VPDASHSLLLVAFADISAAENALPAVRDAPDAAIVVRTEAGRIELQQTGEMAAGEGLVGGGAIGLIAGLVLGLPVGGALLGALGGVGFAFRDTGIPDGRLRQLGEDLRPGHAVLCVLVDDEGRTRLREALAPYGDVLETEVSTAAAP
jgi:uncharacterized membrane protein